MSATYTTAQVAELIGISEWALYQSVRSGEPPIAPIRVGRRLVWPKSTVHTLLGLPVSDAGVPTPAIATSKTLLNVTEPHPEGNRQYED